MNQGLQTFAWARPTEGYSWEDSAALRSDVLMGNSFDAERDDAENRFLRWRDASSLAVSVTPLQDHPTLFRDFSHLEPVESSFLEFANQYGWLGVPVFLEGVLSPDGKSRTVNFDDRRNQGEPFWRWREAHREMSRVCVVLEAILDKDVSTLKQWFHVEADAVRYERRAEHGIEAAEWLCGGKPPIRLWLWTWANRARTEEEKILRFASGWAQKKINDAMGRTDSGTMTSVRVLLNGEKDGMMLHIVPDTLLAAMWLQCARVLTDNPTFKACENCGKWFEVSADARRKGSKYCSDRCKVAAYRRRKELADSFSWLNLPYWHLRESEEWATLSHHAQRVTALKEWADREAPGRNADQYALMDRQNQWPIAMDVLEESWLKYRRDFHDEEPPEAEG